MTVSVTMPRLGESVSEGTVTRWLKQEGEQVEADEPLLEVSTDKVDTEIPAPASGVLQSIKVQEDETVEVGVELAVIGDEGDSEGSSDSDSSSSAEQQDADEGAQDEAEQDQDEQDQDEQDEDEGEQDQAEEEPAESEQEEEPEPEPEPQQAREEEPAQEEQQSEPEPARAQQAEQPQQSSQTQQSNGQTQQSDGEAPYVTPLVRRLAAEHGVDLGSISGTGVGGRIRKQDVLDAAASSSTRGSGGTDGEKATDEGGAKQDEAKQDEGKQDEARSGGSSAAAEQPKAAKASGAKAASSGAQVRGKTEKLSRLRATIAKRMVESLHVSAQLTTVVEVDVTKIANLRKRAKDAFAQREGVPLSFLPFFAVATCEALKQHPKVNSSIDLDAGTVTYHEAEHLGIAVDTDRGLLVPVIHDAGDLNLGGMARKIADIANRTRSSEIQPDELGGGTFTLTNTGSRGALLDTPIINQPQVGILGTGTVVKRPAVVDDPDLGEVIAVRSIIYLALSYDHRIVDGADAARFLTTIKERLEEGSFEGDLGL